MKDALEFSSGGSNGLKLDHDKYNLSEANNLYGTIFYPDSKIEIARDFRKLGWSVRKSSWYDFELESEWSELKIFGENDKEILISGIIANNKFHDLVNILSNFEYVYSLELYSDNDTLIETNYNNYATLYSEFE